MTETYIILSKINNIVHTMAMTLLIITSTTLCCSINLLVCSPRAPTLVNWIPKSFTTDTDSVGREFTDSILLFLFFPYNSPC